METTDQQYLEDIDFFELFEECFKSNSITDQPLLLQTIAPKVENRKYNQTKRRETIGKPRKFLSHLSPEERKIYRQNYIKEWRRNNQINKYNYSKI